MRVWAKHPGGGGALMAQAQGYKAMGVALVASPAERWVRQDHQGRVAIPQLLPFGLGSPEHPGLGNWAVTCEVWWTISHVQTQRDLRHVLPALL